MTRRDRPDATDYIAAVGAIVHGLRAQGLRPILVGGMALVILGSRRVTRDFDFVVARPDERLPDIVEALYGNGLELVAGFDAAGDVAATIANRRAAEIRLRLDAPASAYFLNPATGLRVDLMFDFPVPAADLAARAVRVTVRSHRFEVASEHDLLHLKRIAAAARTAPGDREDIAFLEARLTG